MWLNHDSDEGTLSILTLYAANNIASHSEGIRFDQDGHDAIMQMSIGDSMITLNGRQIWQPLETVLSIYIDMIEAGKVVALNDDRILLSQDNGYPSLWQSAIQLNRYDPWILVPYSAKQLRETINTFVKLTLAIESHMPVSNTISTSESLNQRESLVPEHLQDAAEIPPGFLRDFLSTARKPLFKHIAPGLRVPFTNTIMDLQSHLLFKAIKLQQSSDEDEVMPVCLFPSASAQTVHSCNSRDDVSGPFEGRYSTLTEYPAGLYISACLRSSSSAYEDGCRLTLPFEIGING